MAMVTGRSAPGRCATTTLALVLGMGADPEVRGGVAAISGFLSTLRRDPELRRRCEDAWGSLTARHLAGRVDSLRYAYGPVAALVCALRTIQVVPLKATMWKRGGQAWQFAPRGPLEPFPRDHGRPLAR